MQRKPRLPKNKSRGVGDYHLLQVGSYLWPVIIQHTKVWIGYPYPSSPSKWSDFWHRYGYWVRPEELGASVIIKTSSWGKKEESGINEYHVRRYIRKHLLYRLHQSISISKSLKKQNRKQLFRKGDHYDHQKRRH